MRGSKCFLAVILVCSAVVTPLKVQEVGTAAKSAVAVGRQYATAHVYVASQDLDRFVQSFLATFYGSKSQPALLKITPTPSKTSREAVTTSVGVLSAFAFKTPIPYPFGSERTGYLVTDMDAAVKSAIAHGADLQVAAFPDVIGSDALIEWPGGVRTQLFWHTTLPKVLPLKSIPESLAYFSPVRGDVLIRDFLAFAQGNVISDEADAPGFAIGRVVGTYLPFPGSYIAQIYSSERNQLGCRAALEPPSWPVPWGSESSPLAVRGLLFGACCCEVGGNNRTAVALPVTRTGRLAVGASLTSLHRLDRRRFSTRKKTLPHQQP